MGGTWSAIVRGAQRRERDRRRCGTTRPSTAEAFLVSYSPLVRARPFGRNESSGNPGLVTVLGEGACRFVLVKNAKAFKFFLSAALGRPLTTMYHEIWRPAGAWVARVCVDRAAVFGRLGSTSRRATAEEGYRRRAAVRTAAMTL